MDYGLKELRRFLPEADVLIPEVSKWSVGMHIHHSCLAMLGICQPLVGSTPPVPRSGFSLLTSLVFLSGRIPRGRGKSPEQAIPRKGISGVDLQMTLDESERWLENARQVSPDHWYRHFAFGVLDRDRTLKFIGIHTRHHLRIIQDIQRGVLTP